MKHTTQITNSHCGPAVVQMLLSHLNISITQNSVVRSAKVSKTIKNHGMRISQLADAVYKLYPKVKFWYKRKATIGNLRKLTHEYRYPVGVEWQGLFGLGDEINEETIHDQGHYSIVIRIDKTNKKIIMVDPYKSFSTKNRILSQSRFLKRWWDINQIISENGTKRNIRDERMLFLITPHEITFPKSLGLQLYK